jgi:hypothetical protein
MSEKQKNVLGTDLEICGMVGRGDLEAHAARQMAITARGNTPKKCSPVARPSGLAREFWSSIGARKSAKRKRPREDSR